MNRSILIVICDFLLLSLLTFSTDITHMADENTRPPSKVAVATNNPAGAGADLAAMMRQALEEEQKGRAQLEQQKQNLQQQLQQQAAQTAQARSTSAQQQAQVQAQLAAREQENQRLRAQIDAGQTNLETLNRQLQATSAQAQETQLRLTNTKSEAQREAELTAALQHQLDLLTHSNQLALTEKERLAGQLQVAVAEKNLATERASLMQQEVQDTRAENSKLAEGFKMLATNSSQLTQEIRSNRELAPNTIFSEFVSNRIGASIYAARTGLFGGNVVESKDVQTVVVSDGVNDFALFHVQDTPLKLWDPGTDWNRLTGTVSGPAAQVPVHSLGFNAEDPRVVMIPLPPAEAHKLGVKIYPLSSDPYKFQDAVLIGANEGYYGECNFQIELNSPQYVRLDRSLLKGLFGKFNPSRGDLVFSRTGELLGIMVNDTYCLTIHRYATGTVFPFDADLRSQHTGEALSGLCDTIFDLPPRLH